jgi:hypothetical protein
MRSINHATQRLHNNTNPMKDRQRNHRTTRLSYLRYNQELLLDWKCYFNGSSKNKDYSKRNSATFTNRNTVADHDTSWSFSVTLQSSAGVREVHFIAACVSATNEGPLKRRSRPLKAGLFARSPNLRFNLNNDI